MKMIDPITIALRQTLQQIAFRAGGFDDRGERFFRLPASRASPVSFKRWRSLSIDDGFKENGRPQRKNSTFAAGRSCSMRGAIVSPTRRW